MAATASDGGAIVSRPIFAPRNPLFSYVSIFDAQILQTVRKLQDWALSGARSGLEGISAAFAPSAV
jgi:hypothetical protein